MRYFIKQLGEKDCSFACLKMLLAITYKSKKFLLYPQEDIDKTYSFHDISKIAKKEGVTLFGFRFKNKDNLQKQTNLPVLVPIKSGDSLHMVLIYKIKKSKLLIYDPAGKPYWIDFYEFTKIWNGECLEISKVEGSLFKSKKYSFVSKPYKILVPLFQFLSFGCLATALFFIDSKFSFLIPLFLLFAFIICNFIYNRLLVYEMKSFDNTILTNLNVELTRDIAIRFNNRYGETFVVPEPLVTKVGAKIYSLTEPTKKMSKSENDDKSTIYLLDDPKLARKKIMSAVTDSVGIIQYDPENQPGLANLLTIQSALSGEAIDSIVERYQGKGYGELKKEIGATVENFLTELQAKYRDILASGICEKVLANGKEQAQAVAFKKVRKVKKKLGFQIFN